MRSYYLGFTFGVLACALGSCLSQPVEPQPEPLCWSRTFLDGTRIYRADGCRTPLAPRPPTMLPFNHKPLTADEREAYAR
jgi:hypothetical protein